MPRRLRHPLLQLIGPMRSLVCTSGPAARHRNNGIHLTHEALQPRNGFLILAQHMLHGASISNCRPILPYCMIREMAFAYTKGIILDRWIQQHMPEIRSYHVCLGRQ
jgi:hypothetical protein